MLPTKITVAICLLVVSLAMQAFILFRAFMRASERDVVSLWEMIAITLLNAGVLVAVANYAAQLLSAAEKL